MFITLVVSLPFDKLIQGINCISQKGLLTPHNPYTPIPPPLQTCYSHTSHYVQNKNKKENLQGFSTACPKGFLVQQYTEIELG